MDFSKYKYDQEKKERRVKRNQHVAHLKQIRLKPHIDEHDYLVKMRQAKAFLERKDKVKVNLFFRGREMSFKDQGEKIIARIIQDLATAGTVEKSPMLEGRIMTVVIAPKADKEQRVVNKTEEDEI